MIGSRSTSDDAQQSESPVFFTFWDMDDTSVKIFDNQIKNPHLLLPILLFQMHANNQHVGILTNRSPSDIETGYPVAQYLKDLKTFGISIPEAHVIHGGGENGAAKMDSLHKLDEAIKELTEQVKALKLTEAGSDLADKLSMADELINARYKGKNYWITEFLRSRFDEATERYRFESGYCSKDQLHIGIVDDLRQIAEQTAILGKQFFGVKASQGGNPPKLGQEEDYYSDGYLFEFAERIGFTAFATHYFKGTRAFRRTHPLQKISAMLFAWHLFPDEVKLMHFMEFEKQLDDTECEQIARMLEYISLHANTHTDAHYRPVDELAGLFRIWADIKFLHGAIDEVEKLKIQISRQTLLASSAASDSNLLTIESPRSRGLLKNLSFKRRTPRGSRSSKSASSEIEREVVEHPEIVRLKTLKKSMVQRIKKLKASDNPTVAELAESVAARLKSPESPHGSWQLAMPRLPASTSPSQTVLGSGKRSTRSSHRSRSDSDRTTTDSVPTCSSDEGEVQGLSRSRSPSPSPRSARSGSDY